jgi:putative intracellular protease/amidase
MKKGHTTSTKKRCMVCVTNGAEDIEFVTVVDILRRTKHIDVTVAKVFSPEESHAPSDLKD